MQAHKPTIEFEGPVAFHDQACPVLHQTEKAVFECNDGYFQTSWKAQAQGWIIVQAKTKFQRWLLKTFFGVVPSIGTAAFINRYAQHMENNYRENKHE